MKTAAELIEWCEGAEEQFGSASVPIGVAFFRFQQTIERREKDLIARWNGQEIVLRLLDTDVPVRIDLAGPALANDGSLDRFGVVQIAPGLWHLMPSFHLPDVLHAFVVLYDVPTPAPWERTIILLSGEVPHAV